jgi:hemerythrin-like domain-containing protein
MKTQEQIVNEMMEQTDEMLVEIHKNISEKIGEASADKWVEMLKQVREREIEKQTNGNDNRSTTKNITNSR